MPSVHGQGRHWLPKLCQVKAAGHETCPREVYRAGPVPWPPLTLRQMPPVPLRFPLPFPLFPFPSPFPFPFPPSPFQALTAFPSPAVATERHRWGWCWL